MSAAHHEALLAAVEAVEPLLVDDAVAQAWGRPSALPKMTVGHLAAHLAAQLSMAAEAVRGEPADPTVEVVTLRDHYRRSAWMRADLDDEANAGIREGAVEQAKVGHAAVVERWRKARTVLTPWPQDATAAVSLPWWQWAMGPEDFALTRAMEIVVHGDDLAASLEGLDAPSYGGEVEPVLDLLLRVSVDRHGTLPVLRALSRRERAPEHVSAF